MKKYSLFLGFLALALMVSCQKEEFFDVPQQVKDKVEISAIFADADQTRTQHSADHKKVLWSENDAISVFTVGEESCHDRYYLTNGAGEASAKFQWDKTYNGTITGGVEGEDSQKDYSYVGVYPFMEGTSVKISNDNYEINTVIPTDQKYAENSFGQEVFVMVGVDRVNSKPNIAFKNVGTILIFPLKGKGTIHSVTLKSEKAKIAGKAVVTISAENNFIPSTDMSSGENEITLSCGEGVQLKGEEYTKFCFVLAPGIYDDLVVKFTDTYGNYFEHKIENSNGKEMKRSMSYNMPKMTFEPQGTEQLDLWVKAKAGASMTAERIIPSVKEVDVEGWVKNLKDQANTKALIEEATTYIALKNYKAAYDVLGGIPGFVKDIKTFTATGTHILKVDYTSAGYLKSMLEDIEKIENIQSLLDYMTEFEKVYEASGLRGELNNSLGNIADNFSDYIDAFVDASVNKKPDENLDETAAFNAYKAKVKEQLEESIKGWDGVKTGIETARNGITIVGKTILKADPNFGKNPETDYDAIESIDKYIKQANTLLDKFDSLNDKETIQSEINELNGFEIKLQKSFTVPDLGRWGNKALSALGYTPGDNVEVINVDRKIDPSTFLTGAESEYEKKLQELIQENEGLINAAKETLEGSIREISNKSIVESLEAAIKEPESLTGQVLNYLFAQPEFMNKVKNSLRDIVTKIEEDSKDKVDAGNVDKKQQAIDNAVKSALLNARIDAGDKIRTDFKATNEANLNNGPWAMFKKILNWQKCVEVFTELKILDVYNALVELSAVVDEVITYDSGSILYEVEEFSDYQENVDWWVLKFNEDYK